MSNFIIFMQPPYISLLKYYEKDFTVGSVMMSRIQNTIQNVEVCYFYAAAIYEFYKIVFEKNLYLSKIHDEQNSEHLSKCRSILFLCIRKYINFLKYYEKFSTVGSVMRSRIHTTFRNVEFYYCYSAAVC